ncbi:TPX2-like isoform X2 [Chlorella sorokiniana]|uniref:TPX2-like isoform X2 n=1 Tax=Chlorella sorokiniana TaxID=3076 RepID=A0A2P6TBV0_CHLSO|nr:TPX2-like isoform X2 [Chlorella sorokiniana]|eukprot:PRW18368.1 TPX2-like isoform X2 [Chlorella sorokiniana]
MAAALEGEGPPEGEIDERFEYDAPRFYDFDEGSPAGAPADGWFDTEGPKGLATPPRPAAAEPPPAQAPAGGAAENSGQQGEAGAKGGKGKGAEWRRALASISNTKAQQQQQAQQQQAQQQAATAKPAAKQGTKRRAAAEPAAGSGGAAAAAAAAGTGSRPTSAAASAAAKQRHQATGAQADGSSSPRLHSLMRLHHGGQKTSEQLELERVEREKAEAAALRRKNAAAVKAVLAPPPPPVAHSTKPLTEPVGVELCTSKRHRMHGMETRSMASPFKSAAEQIAAFEGRVPTKARLGDKGKAVAAAADQQQQQQQQQGRGHHAVLTVPHSPRFATKQRVRPPRFKPREVVEAEEMAAMPKFKARPVNKRILQDRSGQLGLPHVETKAPTVPEPFALKTDQRAAEHSGGPHSSAAGSGSTGAGGVFVFGAQGDNGGRVTRSRAAKKAAGGSSWSGQLTQPEPFRLATDMRGTVKRTAAAEPQQEQHESRPVKRARHGAFQLATDERGAAEQARLEGIRRQQEEQARQEAEFKALPLNKAALAGAWKPAPQMVAALTVPQDMALHSDARAAQRRQFDAAMAAKQAAEEAERAEAERQLAEQEDAELREHRRHLGHKALPLPDRL